MKKWVSMSSDVKGEIYEGLLQKNAEDIKSGAGQILHASSAYQSNGCVSASRADENHR